MMGKRPSEGMSEKNIEKRAFLRHFCEEYKEKGFIQAFLED
jgi:hypothetical protein